MHSRTDSSSYHDTERNVQGAACTYDSFPCVTAGCDGRVEYPLEICECCQDEHDAENEAQCLRDEQEVLRG